MEDVRNWKKCPICGEDLSDDESLHFRRCDSCEREYYNNPVAAVAVVFWNKKGQILLVERAKDPHKGKLDTPGGFSDFGENLEEVAKREIKEELGIEIDVKKLRYVTSVPNIYLYKGSTDHTMDVFFEMELDDNLISEIKAKDDVSSVHFFNLKNVDENMIGLDSPKKAIKFLKEREGLKF